jgi:hypothetical protein
MKCTCGETGARYCLVHTETDVLEQLVELQARLAYAEGLIKELLRGARPRDFINDWYDRAKEYLEKRKK